MPQPQRVAADVSAVMPAHNDERFVVEALDSILAQTVLPAEVIVVDDASTDGTPRVLQDYAATRGGQVPIRVIRLDDHHGSERARNVGWQAASGRWIAWCDSDDRWLPTKLERQLAYLEAWRGPEPLVVLGTYGYNVNMAGEVVSELAMGPVTYDGFVELRRRHRLLFVSHTSVLVDRRVVDAVGGYRTDYPGAEDLELWSRMSAHGAVLVLAEPLVHYRKRAGSLQHTLVREQHESRVRIERNWRRREAGEPELTVDEVRAEFASMPWRRRVRHWCYVRGLLHYRRGSVAVVNGARLRGAAHLFVAGVLRPGLVLGGVRGAIRHRLGR